jgi:hypothetical protein
MSDKLPVSAQAAAVREIRDTENIDLDAILTQYPELADGVNAVRDADQPTRRKRRGSGSVAVERTPAAEL